MKFCLLYNSLSDILAYGLVCLLVFLVGAFITRWIFKIDTQVSNQQTMINNQRALIWLMIKKWEKEGASTEEIENFKKIFKLKG